MFFCTQKDNGVNATDDRTADISSDLFSVHDFDIKIDLDVPLSKSVPSIIQQFALYCSGIAWYIMLVVDVPIKFTCQLLLFPWHFTS